MKLKELKIREEYSFILRKSIEGILALILTLFFLPFLLLSLPIILIGYPFMYIKYWIWK